MDKLTEKQEFLFEKYHVGENPINKEYQKYVYQKLKVANKKKRKKLEKSLLNLTNITVNEINMQYRRKEAFESKTGFVLALLCAVFAIFAKGQLFQNLKLCFENIWSSNNLFWVLDVCFALVSMIVSAGYSFLVLYSQDIYGFPIIDRENNFKNAVDDTDLFSLTCLELYTEAFENNNRTLNVKSKRFDKAIMFAVFFVGMVIISLLY